MTKKPVVAVFDFDDTLISGDSFADFLQYTTPKLLFFVKLLKVSPTLARFAAGQLDRAKAKERVLGMFFTGMDEKVFRDFCQAYARRLDSLARKEGLARVAWHQKRGDRVLIISASIEDWIRPWAEQHGITTVLATRLDRERGKLTGRLKGKNCYGQEKVSRLLEEYPDRNSYELYAYGDGKSDEYIFKEADNVFEKRFA